MEAALSGDTDATLHRPLVYDLGRHGWALSAQWAYRTDPGQRIPEVQAYDHNFSATQFTRVLTLRAWLPNVW